MKIVTIFFWGRGDNYFKMLELLRRIHIQSDLCCYNQLFQTIPKCKYKLSYKMKSRLINARAECAYSSFYLKTRFWGQNDKNFNNFDITTDTLLDWRINFDKLKEIIQKISVCGRSINRIKQVSVCCHGYNFSRQQDFYEYCFA